MIKLRNSREFLFSRMTVRYAEVPGSIPGFPTFILFKNYRKMGDLLMSIVED